MSEVFFGTMDVVEPVVWTTGSGAEAWIFLSEKWHPYNPADASVKARVLSEADFKKLFPALPPLPPVAFRPSTDAIHPDRKTHE